MAGSGAQCQGLPLSPLLTSAPPARLWIRAGSPRASSRRLPVLFRPTSFSFKSRGQRVIWKLQGIAFFLFFFRNLSQCSLQFISSNGVIRSFLSQSVRLGGINILMGLSQWGSTPRAVSGWKWRRTPSGSQETVVKRSGDLDAGQAMDKCLPQCSTVCISISFESCNCFPGCPTLQQSLAWVMAKKTFLFLNDTQIIMLHHIVSVIDFKRPWLTSSWNNKAVIGVLRATPKTTPQRFATHNRGCTGKATSNDQFWLKTFVFFQSSISSRSDHNEFETL